MEGKQLGYVEEAKQYWCVWGKNNRWQLLWHLATERHQFRFSVGFGFESKISWRNDDDRWFLESPSNRGWFTCLINSATKFRFLFLSISIGLPYQFKGTMRKCITWKEQTRRWSLFFFTPFLLETLRSHYPMTLSFGSHQCFHPSIYANKENMWGEYQ